MGIQVLIPLRLLVGLLPQRFMEELRDRDAYRALPDRRPPPEREDLVPFDRQGGEE